MSDRAISPEAQTRPDLEGEVERLSEENLRLRDLLIGKDAELGAARGRLAELEDQSRRVANVAARIQSLLPGVTRVVRAMLRRPQRRG